MAANGKHFAAMDRDLGDAIETVHFDAPFTAWRGMAILDRINRGLPMPGHWPQEVRRTRVPK